jgi:histidine triad (HIT) family protein
LSPSRTGSERRIPHLHIQLAPRHKKDGLKGFFWLRKPYEDQETMLRVQTIFCSALMGS